MGPLHDHFKQVTGLGVIAMTSPQSVADCAAVGGALTPSLNLMDDKARPLRDNSGVANPSSPASHD